MEQSLLPRLMPSRVGVVTAVVVVMVVVVTVVVGSAVVMAAAGSPEDMVVGSPVGMVAGLAAAASVAVGAELVLGQL